ncbi:MAG TPA: ABC transporter ATP-binding protein [Granulicella sp.]|nr:ABC transporter ATP-binding protein [Granulicella sp.]
MTTLLRFDAVHFAHGQREVLRDGSFELPNGSCTALIGPNGAGKTTLLRIAAGVLPPNAGRVLLDGTVLNRLSTRQVARSVALVPQHLELPFPFTVQQVVEQGRTPYLGLLRGATVEDRAAVDRAMELADVGALRYRIFNELSGGERQRVKIALGLAQQPKLLLLDEPTQNLDIGRQVDLIDLLHFLRGEGITILASIHDLHLVRGNFDGVLLLSPEEPLRSGTPEMMLQPALLEQAFNCPPNRHPVLLKEGRIA